MSITTMEGLAAVPVDHQVIVDRNTWVRREGGLERSGVIIPLAYFESRLSAGTVEDGDRQPPHQGQWWAGSTRTYYLSEVTERRVYYMSFHRPDYVSTLTGESRIGTWTESRTMRRLPERPQEFEHLAPMIEALAMSQRAVRQLGRELDAVRENPPEPDYMAGLRRDLRDARAYIDRINNTLNG